MKAIQITTDLIAREQSRAIDRNENMITIFLSIEPKFGKTVTAATRSKSGVFYYQVERRRHATVWSSLKDKTNDQIIDEIANQLKAILPTVKKYRTEEATPTTRAAIQETAADGTVTVFYRDDDLAAFNAARERTGHAPTQVPQPNSQRAALERLKAKYPVEEMDALLTHLITIDATAPFKTVVI